MSLMCCSSSIAMKPEQRTEKMPTPTINHLRRGHWRSCLRIRSISFCSRGVSCIGMRNPANARLRHAGVEICVLNQRHEPGAAWSRMVRLIGDSPFASNVQDLLCSSQISSLG
jgi:hypothetical protein